MYNPYLNVKLNQNLDPCTYTNANVYVKSLTWTNAVTLNIVVLRVSESDAATRRSRPITVNVPLLPTQGQKERRNTIETRHKCRYRLVHQVCLSTVAGNNRVFSN